MSKREAEIDAACPVVAWQFNLRYGSGVQHPRPKDFAYVLGWANLHNSAGIADIVHSYDSGTNPVVGDRIEAYCLRLDRELFDLDKRDPDRKIWQRGPVSDPLVLEALETAAVFAHGRAAWFPDAVTLNSSRFFLSFQQITAYHQQVEAVDLTAYDTQAHLLYHARLERERAEKAVAQLKRDAADLLSAIAAVEAALNEERIKASEMV